MTPCTTNIQIVKFFHGPHGKMLSDPLYTPTAIEGVMMNHNRKNNVSKISRTSPRVTPKLDIKTLVITITPRKVHECTRLNDKKKGKKKKNHFIDTFRKKKKKILLQQDDGSDLMSLTSSGTGV